jgi:hypothetical protein
LQAKQNALKFTSSQYDHINGVVQTTISEVEEELLRISDDPVIQAQLLDHLSKLEMKRCLRVHVYLTLTLHNSLKRPSQGKVNVIMEVNVRGDGDSLVFLAADVGAYRRCRLEMVVDCESGATRGQYGVLVPEEGNEKEKEEEGGNEKDTDEQAGFLE